MLRQTLQIKSSKWKNEIIFMRDKQNIYFLKIDNNGKFYILRFIP